MTRHASVAPQQLREMQEAGVWLDGGAEDDDAYFVTEDEEVAVEYGLEEEEEQEPEYDEDEYNQDEDEYDYDKDYEYEYDLDYN